MSRDERNGRIEVSDVWFRYGEPWVLKGVSLKIERGDLLGIIGPNGCGKSTFLRMVAGSLRPERGSVRLFEQEAGRIKRRELARRLAVVPQDSHVAFPFTVLELVLMGRAPHLGSLGFEQERDLEIARKAMAFMDVLPLEARRIDELSGGERQRVVLARALAQEPEVLLLDEPTAFLDIRHQVDIHRLLGQLRDERGLTVVLVSHDLNLAARYCSKLALFSEGTLFAFGLADEVITQGNIEATYRADVLVERNERTGGPVVLPR
ncbi:MAG: ABC transporter ATP-binding protein [Candidatus Latescibacterota bacterium]